MERLLSGRRFENRKEFMISLLRKARQGLNNMPRQGCKAVKNNRRQTISRQTFLPPRAPAGDGPRVNTQIRAIRVRLIDENGEMIGVVTVPEALAAADAAGLDLVEVSPNADPPVCKIIDYGKYKYELQKKTAEARKKQKIVEIKEIKLRPGIEAHDYDVKVRNARRFLEEGDKVKVTLRFRGREMAHIQLCMEVLTRFRKDLEGLGKVEMDARLEGRQAIMVLAPEKVVEKPS